MAFIWDTVSVDKLVDIWANEEIQERLDAQYRNSDIFKQIADLMNEDREFKLTWQQCRNKVKSLKSEYRALKRQHGDSVRTKSSLQDKIGKVMERQPSSMQMIDTSYLSGDENDSDTNLSKNLGKISNLYIKRYSVTSQNSTPFGLKNMLVKAIFCFTQVKSPFNLML